MNFLRIASAFQLLFSTRSFRVAPTSAPRASAPNEFPAGVTCLLASGFDVQRGCQYPEAMQPVPSCDNANFDETCYQISHAERVSGYMRDVRSENDYSSLTRSVTAAEGGGFGVTVSASFSYMKRSQVSEKSLAFFIGASGRTQTRTIQRPVGMRLTPAARELLRQDPRQFITRHGLRYIHSIAYGGSFLGSVTLNSRETVDDRDIQAFASLSVNKGLFSASGSTEFQNTLNEQNLNVSVFVNAQWVGGSGISQDYRNPETLNNMFQDWDRSWRAHPAPLTLSTRRWSDSAEIQEIINTMSAEDRDLFNVPDVTASIGREISRENAKANMAETSVAKALAWNEIQANQTARTCLTNLRRDVTSQLIRIDMLDDASVLMIQQQWLAGDYSWFQADSLYNRYLACVDGVEAPEPEPEPVDLIVGVNSWSSDGGSPPAGYLNEDTNKGFKGKYVYVRPRWEKALVGCEGFRFEQYNGPMYGGNNRVTGDLAAGAGGTYRYIVPVGTRPPQSSVNQVWWREGQGNNHGNCTGDINGGRGGRFLYFCWSHFNG